MTPRAVPTSGQDGLEHLFGLAADRDAILERLRNLATLEATDTATIEPTADPEVGKVTLADVDAQPAGYVRVLQWDRSRGIVRYELTTHEAASGILTVSVSQDGLRTVARIRVDAEGGSRRLARAVVELLAIRVPPTASGVLRWAKIATEETWQTTLRPQGERLLRRSGRRS